jgi:hypothetical protein
MPKVVNPDAREGQLQACPIWNKEATTLPGSLPVDSARMKKRLKAITLRHLKERAGLLARECTHLCPSDLRSVDERSDGACDITPPISESEGTEDRPVQVQD